ncbi:PAS domain-containing protein [Litoreibacter ponti]|uniref:PAS domain-containing protein n=1 Tax=Litoreibacter ponti TaxID=1510457 RepID=A0A2T6BIH3_9RHOB|nr:PAS domain-containing protein [Litoreibacter ponti]PTX55861.1 PAS domain-containing protein [Litoreibacter ponti]
MTHRDGPSSGARKDGERGAEIVSLWQHQAKTEHSALSEMRSYWESLRAGRLVPLRSEIDPREISGALEFGFILERIQPGAVRFRLAGMHLCDLMGMEVRGMPLRSFISPTSRAAFSATLDRVFTKPQIQEHSMVSEDSRGAKLNARLLILPLKSDSGQVDRAIGCFTTDGIVGLAPRRFRVLETRVTNLLTGAETREDSTPERDTSAPQPVAGFAEPQEDFTPAPTQKAERPQLRLVVSNRDEMV